MKDLVMLLSFTMARQETDQQKKLHLECVKSLERRWVEIKGETSQAGRVLSDSAVM